MDKRPGSPSAALVTGGLDIIAVRAPDHPVARALLAATGRPLAAPSATALGRISPTQAAHVLADLGEAAATNIDGGATAHGLEFTIVDARGDAPILLRPAPPPRRRSKPCSGSLSYGPRSIMSGRMRRDSSPAIMTAANLRLDAREVRDGKRYWCSARRALDTAPRSSISAPRANPRKQRPTCSPPCAHSTPAAAQTIAVMPVPVQGLGEAINDRLRRAAAPR